MNGNTVILTQKKIIVMSIVTESSTVLLYVSFTVSRGKCQLWELKSLYIYTEEIAYGQFSLNIQKMKLDAHIALNI